MSGIYDEKSFFEAYGKMARSEHGLAAAGEWHQLKQLLPDMGGMDILDLGCGYGWHCRYASDNGARSILGIDQSVNMIARARSINSAPNIGYRVCSIAEFGFPENAYDLVISNLVLHYIGDLDEVYKRVRRTLRPGGEFVFNIEHPSFTAGVGQSFICDPEGRALCWPIDDYYYPGERTTMFLGHEVKKQHHTLTQILMGLINNGFVLKAVIEATPDPELLDEPWMRDEMRRPMMLLVKAART